MAPSNATSKQPPVINLCADNKEYNRIVSLHHLFLDQFKCQPKYFVRVPGRVNLIGEHIDYCGYSVCPMAIQQDILIAILSTNDTLLKLTNSDPQHKDFTCDITSFSIDTEEGKAPKWHSYMLCGIRGVLEAAPDHAPVGFMAAVNGNVPLASGLSSSSALVCAAALATAQINELKFSQEQLATICAQAERFIGTQGGGMDQAIAFLATAGSAKHIEFDPLRTSPVLLPSDAVFVIAHSLHVLNKAATSDFNQRVVECRLASQVMAKKKGLTWNNMSKLADLQAALQVSLPEMEKLVAQLLHEHPYSKKELCTELDISEGELDSMFLGPQVAHVQGFKLYQRALHVFQEADRVNQFCKVCHEEKGCRALAQLGELMKASHDSLSKLYECSHPQLDRLVKMANEVALGARLTGAGWGGCSVSLATTKSAPALVDMLKQKFYMQDPLAKGRDLDSLVFITAPGEGAQVFVAQDLS